MRIFKVWHKDGSYIVVLTKDESAAVRASGWHIDDCKIESLQSTVDVFVIEKNIIGKRPWRVSPFVN